MKRPSAFRVVLSALYAAVFGCFMYFLVEGRSYYGTALVERPRHEDYWTLKPGGRLGLAFGVAGTAAMTLMHAYSVRKRVRPLRRLGPLARWLDVHILLGITGPLLIVLHSSFKVGGLAALSFWSMVAVASSGVFGRYLYLQIPRTRAGEALSLKEAEAADALLSRRLREEFGVDEERLAEFQLTMARAAGGGALRALGATVLDDLSPLAPRRIRDFVVATPGLPEPVARELADVLREKARLRRRLLMWDALHRLFHHWHVVHKPFAIVMYVFLVVHVVVVSLAGYGLSW